MLKQLNSSDNSLKYNENNTYKDMNPEVLFQRIDKDKKLQEIEKMNS